MDDSLRRRPSRKPERTPVSRSGRRRVLRALPLVPVALLAPQGARATDVGDPPPSLWRTTVVGLDAPLAARLQALQPDTITADDVRSVLRAVPAPRIIALHGSVPLVTMRPFAEFLVAMGYPAPQIRNPADGSMSYSSFVDSRELAGTIAWYYERDGIAPLLIGHSQGGMMAVKALHELAGGFDRPVPVFDPVSGAALARSTIVDPLDGRARPVIGLRIPYAAAIATGKGMRIMLLQWDMLDRLRRIPDSVEAFDGFFIPGDPFTAFDGDDDRYRATGKAEVRNVVLPATYSHVGAPLCAHLAENPATRAWIDAFDPRVAPTAPPDWPGTDTQNLVHAAYIWHSVKRHWCRGAQRLLAAAPRPAAPN